MKNLNTVRADRLTKAYGAKLALDEVSLDLKPGVTALLGPNGAGKTTLLRCLATVLKPDSGSILMNGINYGHPRGLREARGKLGYMPQENGLYPSFTTEAFVTHIAILKGLTEPRPRSAEVDRVLGLTGLTNERHSRIRRLSGGMRRRIVLAQAMLGSPAVVLLDEPTAGLDPEQRMRFRELMTAALDSNTVALLSTHQTEDVAAICSTVLVLAGGRVIFEGSPDDLASHAEGSVWLSDTKPSQAALVWQAGSGRFRSLGEKPLDGKRLNPTIEDGYLMLLAEVGLRAVDPR